MFTGVEVVVGDVVADDDPGVVVVTEPSVMFLSIPEGRL